MTHPYYALASEVASVVFEIADVVELQVSVGTVSAFVVLIPASVVVV